MATSLKLSPKIKEALVLCLQNRPEIFFAVLYGSAAEGFPFQDLDVGLFVDRASVPASAELDYAFALAIDQKLAQLVPLFEKEEVLLAYLFGSLSRGQAGHDVDLAILTGSEPAFCLRAAKMAR